LAREDGRGKKGKCPKCGHELIVPDTTKGRPAISVDKEPITDQTAPPPQKCHPKQVNLPHHTANQNILEPSDDDMTEVYEEKSGFLVPTYDELSLFLMAVMLIVLYLANGGMRDDVNRFAMRLDKWRLFISAMVLLAGMLLCLYHVFTPRKKTDAEKVLMMLFAVTMTAASGIIAGLYLWKQCFGWLLIFPIWNIVNGVLLVLMWRCNIIDEDCIADRDATIPQVIIGLIAVLAIFIFCNYVFKLHWSITYSIYTTSFDKALQSVFPGLTHEEENEQVG
jgi:hypothetical protein